MLSTGRHPNANPRHLQRQMEIAAMRAEVEAGARRREEDQQHADTNQVLCSCLFDLFFV